MFLVNVNVLASRGCAAFGRLTSTATKSKALRTVSVFTVVMGVFVAVSALRLATAHAHGVLYSVEHSRVVAVKVYHHDGEPMANSEFEVFAPGNGKVRHQKGRTDRNGFASFVPDSVGAWRLRVFNAGGHGLDTTIDVASLDALVGAEAASEPAAACIAPSTPALTSPGGTAVSAWGFLLRPIIAVLMILALFFALSRYYRRAGAAQL